MDLIVMIHVYQFRLDAAATIEPETIMIVQSYGPLKVGNEHKNETYNTRKRIRAPVHVVSHFNVKTTFSCLGSLAFSVWIDKRFGMEYIIVLLNNITILN